MSEQLPQIVEESIKLELNLAELYKILSTLFPEDSDFWQKLSEEEEHHASLIKTGKNILLSSDKFSSKLLSPSLQELIEVNNKLNSLLKEYREKPPSRKEAFEVAISLEKSAGEVHYQRAMDGPPSSEYIKMWQGLNENDKDHAKRIGEYMSSKGV